MISPLKQRSVRERSEDDKLLALKMEKGKNSQGIQATFSRCKSSEGPDSPVAFRRTTGLLTA